MSYNIETTDGTVLAARDDILDALPLARSLRRAHGGQLRVRRTADSMIVSVVLGTGMSGVGPTLAAAKENAANGSTIFRAKKRKAAKCPLTNEPHRWKATGAEYNCADCGQLANAVRRAFGWRMNPLNCAVCGSAANALVHNYDGARRAPMCTECKEWHEGNEEAKRAS